jgi:hypothetical protein
MLKAALKQSLNAALLTARQAREIPICESLFNEINKQKWFNIPW